jgi:LacI family transcriptional regulator
MTTQRKVSLKDVAKKVGVSVALVSYVVNGKEGSRVKPELAEVIRQAVKDLNYQPDQVARSLRLGTTKTIGLIVADVSNPFFGKLARIIQDEASRFGYTVVFGNSDENIDKFSPLIDTFLNRKVDGFIIVPVENAEVELSKIIREKIPIVLLDRSFPGINISHVLLDNFRATFDATNCLIEKGYKSIAMVAFKYSLNMMHERIRGYQEAMKKSDLTNNISLLELKYDATSKEIENSLNGLLLKNKRPEAVLFASSTLTLEGLSFANRNNLKIPDDMAFIGFDGGYFFDLFHSPISYVHQPLEEMGKEAVKILIDLLNGSEKISKVIMNPKFIDRLL